MFGLRLHSCMPLAVLAVLAVLTGCGKDTPPPEEGGAAVESGGGLPTETAVSTPTETTVAKTPRQDLADAVQAAVQLLEARNYRQFFVKFGPIEDYKRIRDQGQLGRLDNDLPSDEQHQRLIDLLNNSVAETAEIKFEHDNTTAVTTNTEAFVQPPPPPPSTGIKLAAAQELELVGFAGEISAVVDQCVQTLNDSQFDVFISRMYPVGELRRLRATNAEVQLVSRLAQNPQMVERMIKDLTAIKDATPSADGDVITFTLPVPESEIRFRGVRKPNDRVFKFQKVGGNWRFYDSATQIYEEANRLAKLAPPPLEPNRDPNAVLYEKIGNQWRLQKMPKLRP